MLRGGSSCPGVKETSAEVVFPNPVTVLVLMVMDEKIPFQGGHRALRASWKHH